LREVGTRNLRDDVGGGGLDLPFCVVTRGELEDGIADAYFVLIVDEDLALKLIECG
jgi:hypothetical protein